MANEDMIWELKKDSIKALLEKGRRVDERAFDEYRQIEIKNNFIPRAEGSSLVKIGNTQVLVGVKMEVGTPYPDNPEEGILTTNAELVPIAAPTFYSGPPDENSIELARVVDRGIRESKMISLEELVIEPKEKVWMVMIDIHVLDYDGNLFDAASIAAVNALKNTRIPKYEDETIIRGEYARDLPTRETPVSCTFVKIGNSILLDPSLVEEKTMDARMTMTTTEKEELCAAQKGGSGWFTRKEIEEMLEKAIEKGKEIRKMF